MSEENERLPPHNRDAERCVLGSMLRDNAVIGDVIQIIRDESFYADAHQKVYRAISTLYDKGHPVDLVLLADLLKEQKYIEDVGGYGYLAELWDAAPTGANAKYYARIIRDKAIVRSLIHAGTELLRDCYDQVKPGEELLEEAEKKILDISQMGVTGQTIMLKEALRATMDRIDERATKQGSVRGLATGWHLLDDLTAGFQPSDLIVIAARPSVGKTALGSAVAVHAALNGVPVLYISIEQRAVELAERIVVARAGVDGQYVRRGIINSQDVERLNVAVKEIVQALLFLADQPSQTMPRITRTARQLKDQHGLGLLVVDYLQLVEPENRKDIREQQVAAISRGLKHLARELEIPVVALAQINREADKRANGRPRLSDLRESGAIEADADVVILLHRDDLHRGKDDPGEGAAETGGVVQALVIVAKQRNGPNGEVKLDFRKNCMRFENQAIDPFVGR